MSLWYQSASVTTCWICSVELDLSQVTKTAAAILVMKGTYQQAASICSRCNFNMSCGPTRAFVYCLVNGESMVHPGAVPPKSILFGCATSLQQQRLDK